MDARQLIITLGTELADQDQAAHDLYTWLPSHKVAEDLKGDYVDEQWIAGLGEL